MKKEFDLIVFPFKFNNRKLFKNDNDYETRLSTKLNSKVITAQKKQYKKVFLHIIVDDDKTYINGKSKNVFEFNNPVDFMIPTSKKTEKEFEKFHNAVLSDDLNGIYKYAKEFKQKYKKVFHFYPIPRITQSAFSSMKNLQDSTKSFKKNDFLNPVLVKFGEKIPLKPSFEKNITRSGKKALAFVESLFEKHKGIRMKYLINKLTEFTKKSKFGISINLLKATVKKVAYLMTTGPWNKTWIKYGVDPMVDKEMVLYQSVFTGGCGNTSQLFEHPHLLEILEKEKHACFRDVVDFKFGYLTAYGFAKCKLVLQNLGTEDYEEETDYDLFD